jgi:uncharacterized protein
MTERRPARERLATALLKLPFRDMQGRKGFWERFSRAQPHVVRRASLVIEGWPKFERPMRIALLADFHVGSHTDDIPRLSAIVDEAAACAPDLVLFGGDYMNMQPFGSGRVPPQIIAAMLARIDGPSGRFAILGNHDYAYSQKEVTAALRTQGIAVLDHVRTTIAFAGRTIDIVGVPDAHLVRPQAEALLRTLSPERPAIVLAHDPVWFAQVPAGPYLTLSGHTHGGQFKFPVIGIVTNASLAPLRWSHGHVNEGGRQLYVTAGLGTSGVPIRINVPPEFAILDVNGQ